MSEEKNMPYKRIAAAVVTQAIEDYMCSIRDNDARMAHDCETFFLSQYFQLLSDADGETLMNRIRKGVIEFQKRTNEAFESGKLSKKTRQKGKRKYGEIERSRFDKESRAFICPICGGNVFTTLTKKGTVYKAHCEKCLFNVTKEKVVKND